MATPFLGQIRMFAGNFAPRGNAFCNGQTLSIAQNTALFALLGTTYGGNGQTTFALPNLQSRFPVHFGQGPGLSNYDLGQVGGAETVTLLGTQIPAHSHIPPAQSAAGTAASPTSGVCASSANNQFNTGAANANMSANAIGLAGGNQPHTNIPPYLAIYFIIALQGIFPSRN